MILYPKTDENYSCEVQHPGLISPLRASFIIGILNQQNLPIINGYRKNDLLNVGDNLTLTCTVKNGHIFSRVIWLRNNVEVDTSYIVTFKNDIVNSYNFIVTADDNQVLYKCLVSNNVTDKSLETSVRLNVQCKCKVFFLF